MVEQLLLLLLFIVLSAVFSSTEIAMFSVSEIKISHLVEQKMKGAKVFARLRKDSHKLLITILIGNNVANVGSASLATAIAIQTFGNSGVGIATGVMTLLLLVFGEITPKAFATKHKEKISLRMAPIILVLMKIFFPLVWIFDKITSLFVSADEQITPKITEEEVKNILKISEEQGSIKEQEEKMIQNIFELDDTVAADIMTARPDVVAYDITKKVKDVVHDFKEHGYSRIPVYEDDLDHVKGVLYAKDLITADENVGLSSLLRDALFVPENKRVDTLLLDFKKKKIHLAIVVNEHGTVVGIITIEDLIEEIVGEIYDETDKEEVLEKDIRKINDTEFLIKGKTEIEDVEEALGVELSDDDHSTLSGFVMHRLNHVPKEKEHFQFHHYKFTVQKVENNRVELVHVKHVEVKKK